MVDANRNLNMFRNYLNNKTNKNNKNIPNIKPFLQDPSI